MIPIGPGFLHFRGRDMKGNASTHIPNQAYRENWETIFVARQQHQEICDHLPEPFQKAKVRDMYQDLNQQVEQDT